MADLQTSPTQAPECTEDVQHIVDWWEDVVWSRLRGEAPRALCGVMLEEDPDGRPTLPEDPICPRCQELY